MSEHSYHKEHSNRPGLFLPIILVVVGAVLLLNTLGYVAGDVKDLLIRLWPVLLIAGGIDGIVQRNNIIGEVFWICVGAIFLLSNFGFLGWNVWQMVFRFWPIVIIVIGIEIAFGRKSIWLSLIGVVLVLALLAGAVLASDTKIGFASQQITGEKIAQESKGATQSQIKLNPAVGYLKLEEGKRSDVLLSGEIRAYSGERVNQEYSLIDNKAIYELHSSEITISYPMDYDNRGWYIYLNPQIQHNLVVSNGAGETNLDLSELAVNELEVNMGVGNTSITLPTKGDLRGKINGAIGKIKILIPQGAAVQIKANTAIGDLDLPDELIKQANTYQSRNFDEAKERIILDVGLAIGKVDIQYQ
jgi:hypothetical protein